MSDCSKLIKQLLSPNLTSRVRRTRWQKGQSSSVSVLEFPLITTVNCALAITEIARRDRNKRLGIAVWRDPMPADVET